MKPTRSSTRLGVIALPFVLMCGLIAPANALLIQIGRTTISDGTRINPNAHDLDLDPDVIRFNNFITGFMANGYRISGTVDRRAGDALINPGGIVEHFLRLTSFDIERPAGAAGGPLMITFSDVIPGPLPAGNLAFGIKGVRTATGGNVVAQSFVHFLGDFVQATIRQPIGNLVVCDNAGRSPVPCEGGRPGQGQPPKAIPATGMRDNLSLIGILTIDLANVGDAVHFDNSLDLGFSDSFIEPVVRSAAEPGTWFLLAIGLTSLFYLRRRHGSILRRGTNPGQTTVCA